MAQNVVVFGVFFVTLDYRLNRPLYRVQHIFEVGLAEKQTWIVGVFYPLLLNGDIHWCIYGADVVGSVPCCSSFFFPCTSFFSLLRHLLAQWLISRMWHSADLPALVSINDPYVVCKFPSCPSVTISTPPFWGAETEPVSPLKLIARS